jgi:hypothetical protein
MTISDEERNERILATVSTDMVESLEEEMTGVADLPLWRLWFVDSLPAKMTAEDERVIDAPGSFGLAIVPASGALQAAAAAARLGCNPGTAAMIYGPFDRSTVKPEYIGRLLTTPEEVEEAGA